LFGCAYGVVVALGLGVADGTTVDLLLGSLFAVDRGPSLLSAGLPFGLVAFAYAGFAQQMPSSARGAFAAWLWPGAEILRSLLAPAVSWTALGTTQNLGQMLALGSSSAYVVSFVMVLVSCTAVELMLDRSSLHLESRSLLRWVGLPALAVLALYVNLATAVPAARVDRGGAEAMIDRPANAIPMRAERRVADRPVLTAGAILTAI
jgi:apolipoprotein N-acyltransferase